jgi:hypothetical protein
VSEKDPVRTIDFGAPDGFGAHRFRVEIPASRTGDVLIVEEHGFHGGQRGLPEEETRAILGRALWSEISEVARQDFNERLKTRKLATSRWKVGVNLLDRFLGKELCVLAWAAERATPEQCAVICTKWAALRPEERWWLFSTTAAEGGLAQDRERGWRKALYYALSDGDARLRPTKARRSAVRDAPELPLFETKE